MTIECKDDSCKLNVSDDVVNLYKSIIKNRQVVYYKNKVTNLVTRVQRFTDGIEYVVAPVVAMVEGVHHGSAGPAFYPASELRQMTQAWNGVPLTINHPEDVDGNKTSVDNPDIIENYLIGFFYNVIYENGQLKGEIWVDPKKVERLSPETLETINSGRLEVSIGLFADGDGQEGVWKDEKFSETLSNFRPDHLALLPGGEGACNWDEGCGVRFNEKKGGEMKCGKDVIVNLKKNGYRVLELGHSKIRDQLQRLLNDMDTDTEMFFLREVFNKHFIFEKTSFNENSQLMKQSFSVSKEEVVSLKGDPVSVKEKVDFIENSNSNFKEEENKKMNDAKAVKALISNEKMGFVEKDEEMLLNMEGADFDKFVALEAKLSECDCDDEDEKIVDNKQEEIKPDSIVNEKKEESKVVSFKELLANASPEDRENYNRGMSTFRQEKASLINSILANENNKFSKENLEAMSIDVLDNMVSLIIVPEDSTYDYSGNSPRIGNRAGKYDRFEDGSGVPEIKSADKVLQENYNKKYR